ncbi:MAG: hypothetical protein ACPGTQ_03560 [Colwellia sp.]
MARILIVASEYEPFQSSGINRVKFIKSALEDMGHFVAVLTTNANAQGLKSEKMIDQTHNIYRVFGLSLFCRRILSSRRLPIYQSLAKTGKYAAWIPFAERKGIKLVRDLDIDTVFTSFPDFASLDVAKRVSKATGQRLIIDFRDPPFWIYDVINTGNKQIEKCQRIVKEAIEASSFIITCTEQSFKALRHYYKFSVTNIIIANGFDAEIIDRIPSNRPVEQSYFEIIHIGSFYDKGRDMKPVISAIEENQQYTDKKIRLRLIGDKPDKATLNFIEQHAKNFEVSIEPAVAMIDALTISKNADVLLLLQGDRFDRQIPTKVYEYLALNRPIWAVTGRNGETKKLLDAYSENVIYSDYNNEKHIKKQFCKLFKFQAQIVDCEELSRQSQIKRLMDLNL